MPRNPLCLEANLHTVLNSGLKKKSILVPLQGPHVSLFFAQPTPVDEQKASHKADISQLNLCLPLTDKTAHNKV